MVISVDAGPAIWRTCSRVMPFFERDGKQQTYFVSYNDTGRVMNYGFQSCKDYDTDASCLFSHPSPQA
jgi:hypothetical protein